MAARKGTRPPAAGLGRKRGVPNKTTGAAREMFAQFLDANADRVQVLFDKVAMDDPARALELLAKLAEYVIPKLARTEIDARVTDQSPPVIQVRFVDPKDPR